MFNESTLASNVEAFGKENQEILSQSRIAILGQNTCSDYITMLAIGLGVGDILIQGERSEQGLEKLTHLFDDNPQSTIHRQTFRPLKYKLTQFEPTHIFSSESTFASDELEEIAPTYFFDSHKINQSYENSLLASLLIEQFRKSCFSYATLDKKFAEKNLQSLLPFHQTTISQNSRSNHTLLIGAGGIGTYAGLELVNSTIPKVTILDYDTIDAQNLNRQLLYLQHVGEEKGLVLSNTLNELSNSSRFGHVTTKIESEKQFSQILQNQNIDQVYCATDNFTSRKIISQTCAQLEIPLIEAGCNTMNAIVTQYEPHKTKPVHETRNFDAFSDPVEEQTTSCVLKINPSVVIPNLVAGSLMYATSLPKTLQNKSYFLPDSLHYNTFSQTPFEVQT